MTARGSGSAYTLGTTATSKSATSGRTSARKPSMRNAIAEAQRRRERPALLDVVGAEVLRRVADDDEGDAPAPPRRHRVERQARRAHHLDVALAPQHAPVAAEDDGVGARARAPRAACPDAGGIEVGDVERVVDDPHLVRAVREERRRRTATRTRCGAPPPRADRRRCSAATAGGIDV